MRTPVKEKPMMLKKSVIALFFAIYFLALSTTSALAKDKKYLAVQPLTVTSPSSAGIEEKVRNLLEAYLSDGEYLVVLDRENLGTLMDERTLATTSEQSGFGQPVDPGVKGADYILRGSILDNGQHRHLFLKLVRIHDSTMKAISVSANASETFEQLVSRAVNRIHATIENTPESTVKQPASHLSRAASLANELEEDNKPTLSIAIEETHYRNRSMARRILSGRNAQNQIVDPAAETEFILFASESGFPVIDPSPEFAKYIDVKIYGEGFTEVSYLQGTSFGITARLEIKAIDLRTGRIVAIDRQTSTVLAGSENIGSKNALAKASAAIAERLLPKLTSLN